MQTRKRAKSISFGKPKKEAEVSAVEKEEKKVDAAEKEEVKAEAPEKEVTSAETTVDEKESTKTEAAEPEESPELTEAAKKVADLEEPAKVEPKEEDKSELSDKPEAETSSELSATLTSSDEFLTDATSPANEETEAKTEEKDEAKSENSGLSTVPEPSLSTPVIEPETKSDGETLAPSTTDTGSASQELSPTPPPSAFSLQEGGGDGIGDGGGRKKNFLVYFLVIALFSFILGIGAMAALASGLLPFSLPKELPFSSQLQTAMNSTSPTPVPSKAPVPTVAPTEKPVDLASYTISVLNGSGVSGKAADVRGTLTTAGFKVSSTGNAANNDFEATQISAKKAVDEAFIEKLKAELGKEFKVEVSAAPAPASQATDVVVTIGSETN